MIHKKTMMLVASATFGLALAGCVQLGLSQKDGEVAYATSAAGTTALILSGRLSNEAVGNACLADEIAYTILTSTRNVADGVSYVPSDAAHASLQSAGVHLAPAQCVPPPAT